MATSSKPTTTTKKSNAELNPKTTRYEFLGPIGAFGFVTVLPLLVLFLAICCNKTGYPSQLLFDDWRTYFDSLLQPAFLKSLVQPIDMLVYLGFVTLEAVLYICLPGDLYPGTELRNGQRLKYRMNGFTAYHATLFFILYFLKDAGLKPLLFVYDHWSGLAISSILFSYAIALFVYLKSFAPDALLALGGNSGNPLYDYMIGRELNPRIGEFDIKFFTELRPGMIGWQVINLAFAAKQYVDLGYVTNSMILVQSFQAWYIVDSLWNEEAVLTTMDMTTDGFGFMLAFGLYTWVPMNYTLQARYLVDYPRDLSWFEFGAIVALNFLGYYIFRSANSQKNEFRSNPNSPNVKDLKFITTKTGSKLITSSWWGYSRHINYLGDWFMSLSWSLPCGFGSIVPYFYPIYFAVLLVHRQLRDDHKCKTKYGEDWDRYCEAVKYRIIPGIY